MGTITDDEICRHREIAPTTDDEICRDREIAPTGEVSGERGRHREKVAIGRSLLLKEKSQVFFSVKM